MTLNPFFIIAILGPPPLCPHRRATRGPRPAIGPVPAIIGSPRPVSSPSLSRVNRVYEKNREPRRAILHLATNRKSSRYKASKAFLSTSYSAFWSGRDFSRRLLSRHFASASSFWPFTWLLYVAHYRLVKANIRFGSSTRKSCSTASFPLPLFYEILFMS